MKMDEDDRESKIGYFIVEPVFANTNLSSIVCETVLTKNLGAFSRWEKILDRIYQLNYNMVHFTPMNILGQSNSCYSIYHHLKLTNQLNNEDENGNEVLETSENEKEEKLQKLIDHFAEKGLFSICDVVWNHTSIDTPWLKEETQATYNLQNSPHLRPAYTLDRALQRLNNKFQRRAEIISSKEDIEKILDEIDRRVLPSIKLWEFSIIDIPKHIILFREFIQKNQEPSSFEHQHHPFDSTVTDECIIHGDGRRGSKMVRMSCIYQIFRGNKESLPEKCLTLRRLLDRYNLKFLKQWDLDKMKILENLRNHLFYERVQHDGPRYNFISKQTPLFPKYFTTLERKKFVFSYPIYHDVDDEEEDEEEDDDIIQDLRIDGADNIICANAGWVYGVENTIDLIAEENRIYLCRQLVVWSDCAKLRYGKSPDDSPFLWNYMKEYTCQIARLFHGVRIDNCHSTPIHIAKFLLQAARSIRPNLVVIAELFTDKLKEIDFCEQLGLTFLIRESMNINTPNQLCDKVYEYSGGIKHAIGSLFQNSINISKNPFYDSLHRKNFIYGHSTRGIFFECTHDNDPPSVQRTTGDSLPNSTIVTMTNSAIGSVLGYDQLVPHKIDVVTEKRLYPLETIGGGMECCKVLLNSLHRVLHDRGYEEFHIHQEGNLIMIVRHHPQTHKSVYTLIHTSFTKNNENQQGSTTNCGGGQLLHNNNQVQSFTFSGEFVEELFVGLIRTSDKIPHQNDEKLINGIIPSLYWPHQSPINKHTSAMYNLIDNTIQLNKFPKGSILAFSTKLPEKVETAKIQLQEICNDTIIKELLSELTLVDLNKILYRTNQEDQIEGTYHLENWGSMSYCGIAGIILCFNSANENNLTTVSHPICKNLREGSWLLDFTRDRLTSFPKLHSWISNIHGLLKKFYNFLLPKYFHWFISKLYFNLIQHGISLMSPFIQNGNSFIKSLSLVSIQMFGNITSSPLNFKDFEKNKISPSLAAGLPHFSAGYMRNWGRDSFISLRGLLLITGRFNDALYLIQSFASTLRHGLIPNLLSSGNNPRYNARDAVWWFLQSLQDYCSFVYKNDWKEIVSFLKNTKVQRFYPSDDQDKLDLDNDSENSLEEIIYEILSCHFRGISFVEWNAGYKIDSHMTQNGFHVQVKTDKSNGFIFGGNKFNCGTWMDKMGENKQFGSLGVPSTPRDGADIEIIGLLTSTLRWVSKLSEFGFHNDAFVCYDDDSSTSVCLSYSQWHQLIIDHFEKYFWIPVDGKDDIHHHVDFSLISRRGIYKDTFGSSDSSSDYCFRPNICVAMVVAPELFKKEHALICLKNVTKILLGKLGMKTLDPSHPRYAPNYSTESTNGYYEANGFNYHQGPVCFSFFYFVFYLFIYFCFFLGMGLVNWLLSSC